MAEILRDEALRLRAAREERQQNRRSGGLCYGCQRRVCHRRGSSSSSGGGGGNSGGTPAAATASAAAAASQAASGAATAAASRSTSLDRGGGDTELGRSGSSGSDIEEFNSAVIKRNNCSSISSQVYRYPVRLSREGTSIMTGRFSRLFEWRERNLRDFRGREGGRVESEIFFGWYEKLLNFRIFDWNF